MCKEVWKCIKGYEGLYQVSNLGRIKSFGKGGVNQYQEKVRYLSVCQNSSGYGIVVLTKNKVNKSFFVHRLVAFNFIPNNGLNKIVNHIDGNKLNNYFKNLEWCSYSENAKHSYRVLGRKANKPWKGKYGSDHTSSKVVFGYSLSGKLIYRFKSVIETGLKGFSPNCVARVARGERKHHQNIIWKYI